MTQPPINPVHIDIHDPEDLPRHIQQLANAWTELPEEEQDKIVNGYVTGRGYLPRRLSPRDVQYLVHHPRVIESAVLTLERLIARAQDAHKRTKDKDVRREINLRIQALHTAENNLRPYLNLALNEAARLTDRDRAYKLLGELLYDRYTRYVIGWLKEGASVREARERLTELIAKEQGA